MVPFRSIALHIFATNNLPSFTGGFDRGVRRRLGMLTFNRSIPRQEQIVDLGRRVAAEETDLLLAFAVSGASRLLRQKAFTEPPSSQKELHEWFTSGDPVAAFVQAQVRPRNPADYLPGTKDRGMPSADIFAAFERWAKAAGYRTNLQITGFVPRFRALATYVQKAAAAPPTVCAALSSPTRPRRISTKATMVRRTGASIEPVSPGRARAGRHFPAAGRARRRAGHRAVASRQALRPAMALRLDRGRGRAKPCGRACRRPPRPVAGLQRQQQIRRPSRPCRLDPNRGDVGKALDWSRSWLGLPARSYRMSAGDMARLKAETARRQARNKADAERLAAEHRRRAQAIWDKAKPLVPGDTVDLYLKGRGIDLSVLGRAPAALRCVPSLWAGSGLRFPAMVAAISDGAGRFIALHRTFCNTRATS